MTEDNNIIHQGRLIALHKERVDLPDGNHTFFDIVKHPGGSVIVAIDDKEQICLLKQWRHAVQQNIWEFPAGCLEVGEPPIDTAKRELEEEAGITAQQWQNLGHVVPSPGFCNEILYFFEARDLRQGTLNLDDAEQLEAHWFSLDEVKAMVRAGEIIDAKSLALLCRLFV
ncbi:MAG: NUDIX hydrolase [Acidiferrobacterales bacterium]|nr:NUDIX hydrolase [Acidiferrobacterales bacterium]